VEVANEARAMLTMTFGDVLGPHAGRRSPVYLSLNYYARIHNMFRLKIIFHESYINAISKGDKEPRPIA
jgi:hypothetical protein